MSKARSLPSTAGILLLIGASVLSCQRKAPGPEECARFAEAVVRPIQEPLPVMLQHIELTTQECLTRPYDREMLQCVLGTRNARLCLIEFHRRKGQRE